jgi:peptidoglycan/xylan/chitin deacetylase (PgdA/CDA1 family)
VDVSGVPSFSVALLAPRDPASGSGWQRILDQEGVPHHLATSAADLPGAALLLGEGELPEWAAEHLRAGAVGVLSGARALPDHEPGPAQRVRAVISGFTTPGGRWAAAPGPVTLLPRGTGPAGPGAGTFRVHEDRVPKYDSDPDVLPVLATHAVGRGTLLYSPVALTELLMAEGDRLRRFSELSPVTERVSAIDKADVADTLLALLRAGFRRAGLPLVRLGRYPGGAPSVLIVRVDVDGAFAPRTQMLLDATTAAGLPASFFVNADLCRAHPGLPEEWPAAVEVGQHADVHTAFDTVEQNLRNLTAGAAWVEERTGRAVRSFVAPRGLWNPALGRALRTLGYPYSSDFGLDFDSLPFRDSSGLLQVPVHPYSPERARRWADETGEAPLGAAQTAAYYEAVARRQIALGRPVHVYGHAEVLGPMAGTVVPALAALARAAGLAVCTLGEYAAFWQRREQVRLAAAYDDATGVLELKTAAGERDGVTVVVEPGTTASEVVLDGTAYPVVPGRELVLEGPK